MTEVLHPRIHRSYTAPAVSLNGHSESRQERRVLDWQFDVAQSTATPSKADSVKPSPSAASKAPPPSLPRSKAHSQRSATVVPAKSTTSSSPSAQEQFKQVPSLHASRQHEDYEIGYDGRIAPPLAVSRIVRRSTTTTTCDGSDGHCKGCSCDCETSSSQKNIHIQNVQQHQTAKEKEDDDSGISGKNVVSALLGVAAGAALAYAMFNKFGEKKEEKEEPIRMVSRAPSVSGNQMGAQKSFSLGVIDEDRRADHETFRPETRLAIMPASFDENVWADDKHSKVSKRSARKSADMETLVDEDVSPIQVLDREAGLGGHKEKNLAVESWIARSQAPESYVSARSHVSAGSARSGSHRKVAAEIPANDRSDVSSDSESESEEEIHVRRGSRVSAREVPETVVSRHTDRRSHINTRDVPKPESVVSHRSRRSHGSRRSHASARDIPLPSSEVSSSSRRSHRYTRDQDTNRDRDREVDDDDHHHHRERNKSRDSKRSSRRSHVSVRRDSHDDDHQHKHRDPHELFRETEHSTDAIIGANFAAQVAAVAAGRRSSKSDKYDLPESTIVSDTHHHHKKSRSKSHSQNPTNSTNSNLPPHKIPLPDSADARSCLTAREIPLPESELGGARVKGGVYGGGGLGLGLGNRLSARFVPLPESEVGGGSGSVLSLVPEDSISNVGGRRRRRR